MSFQKRRADCLSPDMRFALNFGDGDATGHNLDRLGIMVEVAGIHFERYLKLAASLGLPFSVVTDWDRLDGTKPPLGKARTIYIRDAY